MKRYTATLLGLLLTLCAQNVLAQLYKSVGPDGKVTYSDTPPPKSAGKVESKAITTSGSTLANLPYELAEAARTQPVVLYTAANCDACDQGRKMLTDRGIPFTEKTISSPEDIAYIKKITKDERIPVLTVGRAKQSGFEAGGWNSALTAAGYPESSQLPRGYRNPPATAAVPPKPEPKVETARKSDPPAPPPQDPQQTPSNAPPDFRF